MPALVAPTGGQQADTMRKVIEQLRRERKVNRQKVSESAQA